MFVGLQDLSSFFHLSFYKVVSIVGLFFLIPDTLPVTRHIQSKEKILFKMLI